MSFTNKFSLPSKKSVKYEHSLFLLLYCLCLCCRSFLWQYVVFLSGSESVQDFYRLFVYVLPLEIQLSKCEGWDPINQFNPATFLCLSWISMVTCCGLLLCSVSENERLILVELMTRPLNKGCWLVANCNAIKSTERPAIISVRHRMEIK